MCKECGKHSHKPKAKALEKLKGKKEMEGGLYKTLEGKSVEDRIKFMRGK